MEWSFKRCHLQRDRYCHLNCSSSGRLPETSLQQCQNHCLPQETVFSPCMLSFPVCICFVPHICIARCLGKRMCFQTALGTCCSLALLPNLSLILSTGCVDLTGCGSSAPTCFPPGEAEYLLIFLQVLIWSFPNRFILFPAHIFNFLRSAFGNYLC